MEANKEYLLDENLVKEELEIYFPKGNQTKNENYANLLEDLKYFKITTKQQLLVLIKKYKDIVLEIDKELVTKIITEIKEYGRTAYLYEENRLSNGVFSSYVGLIRLMLELEFGKTAFDEYFSKHKKYFGL